MKLITPNFAADVCVRDGVAIAISEERFRIEEPVSLPDVSTSTKLLLTALERTTENRIIELGNKLVIREGHFHTALPIFPQGEIPAQEKPAKWIETSLAPASGLGKCTAEKSAGQPPFEFVYFHERFCAATNGRLFVVCQIDGLDGASFALHPFVLDLVPIDRKVMIGIGERSVCVEWDGNKVWCQLPEQNVAVVQQVKRMESEYLDLVKWKFSAHLKPLLEAIKSVTHVHDTVELEAVEGGVSISARNPSGSATTKFDCQTEGETCRTMLNSRYLEAILKAIGLDQTAEIGLSDTFVQFSTGTKHGLCMALRV